MTFGERIAERLKQKGWSLSRLSKESGVPVQTLHNWRTGRRALNIDQVKRVAVCLETPLHELLFGVPDPHARLSSAVLEELFSGDVRITVHRIRSEP